MCIQPAKPCGEPPNFVDIEIVVSKLKNGKVTGQVQILAKLTAEGGKELSKVIY